MNADFDRRFLMDWLTEEDPLRLADLWRMADTTRRENVGEDVHLRGLVEISNFCIRQCAYCGLRAPNMQLQRYRMMEEEIMECARKAWKLGCGTLVLQGGEDPGLTRKAVGAVVRRIKEETPLAVTLSLGERLFDDLAHWRRAGADRYFIRFETSDTELYRRIHPSLPSRSSDRLAILEALKEMGYETGSGIMIGIPGQHVHSLVEDLLLFRSLDLDMIGVGPYLPHPETPLGRTGAPSSQSFSDQVLNSETMVYKVMALSRLLCPEANIPVTTGLATLNREGGYEQGLQRGGNVIMPGITPLHFGRNYEIYPGKVRFLEITSAVEEIKKRIRSIGRTVGSGPGERQRHVRGTLPGRVSLE